MVTNLGEEKPEKRVLQEGPVLQKKTIARCRAVRHLDNLEIMRQNWEGNSKNITEEILRIYALSVKFSLNGCRCTLGDLEPCCCTLNESCRSPLDCLNLDLTDVRQMQLTP